MQASLPQNGSSNGIIFCTTLDLKVDQPKIVDHSKSRGMTSTVWELHDANLYNVGLDLKIENTVWELHDAILHNVGLDLKIENTEVKARNPHWWSSAMPSRSARPWI
jgi:hypothetical protein